MNIFLIRHGKAEPTFQTKKDIDRELTKEGINIIKRSVEFWKNGIVSFDFIITSPFKRAVQTGEIIAELMNYKNDLIKDNALSPGCSTRSVIQLAEELNADNIAFVGHQPDMSYHISSLVCNSQLNLKFSPASIAKVSFKGNPIPGKGILEFLLPPF
ncbi:MAG: phosphohistidine phosphatase SixA [Ignavibacteria bacterium]|nr:MAG: phosphohistidine phosphatase SixA [Ignavibacteria bacterium]